MGSLEMSTCSGSTDLIELEALGGVLRFASATELNTFILDASTATFRRSTRAMESSGEISDELKSFPSIMTEIPAEHLNDFLIAGATAMTDIDNVINELQVARDYLQTEAERLWRANAHYASFAKAAAKGIADGMGN
jgi:hypothetical protein